MTCVCGARATYRLARGSQERYRCAACANGYTWPEWSASLLQPKDDREDVFQQYCALRRQLPAVSPSALWTLPRFREGVVLEHRFLEERGDA